MLLLVGAVVVGTLASYVASLPTDTVTSSQPTHTRPAPDPTAWKLISVAVGNQMNNDWTALAIRRSSDSP